jgi:hypothetical protein
MGHGAFVLDELGWVGFCGFPGLKGETWVNQETAEQPFLVASFRWPL